MTIREQIMDALVQAFDGLSDNNGNTLKFVGRRLRDPDHIDTSEMPCLYLIGYMDDWEVQSIDLPPVRSMTVWAWLYLFAPDENTIPDTQINNFIEAIEDTLSPDTDDGGSFTLGGLARYCTLSGSGIRALGDTTGRSLVTLPIKIGLYQ